jgi:hypothetical protein
MEPSLGYLLFLEPAASLLPRHPNLEGFLLYSGKKRRGIPKGIDTCNGNV